MQLRPHQEKALEAMARHPKGQIIVPTGGGKTLIAIQDAVRQLEDGEKTIVVVAPRLLLAEQLCSEFMEEIENQFCDKINVMHVHSGETKHFSTTKPVEIAEWCKFTLGNKFIFTTYHSLHRIQQSYAHVDTIYFDEAHNSVQKNFIESVEYFSMYSERCYFFEILFYSIRTFFYVKALLRL